ncbi:MAG TPA: DUF4112 domain-containing protein [Caulobacter sp.]|nr:DUF4112 domain-containing protein [Caulobacter sp.]
MFLATTHIELHNVRTSIERTKRVSDGLIKLGPFSLGLDGILGFVPWAGSLYSGAAGLLLLWDGLRARATPMVLTEMFVILLIDTAAPWLPKIGGITDALFSGHKWAADMLLKHMEETIYFEGTRDEASGTAEYRDLMARVRAGKEKRRVVFLGKARRNGAV